VAGRLRVVTPATFGPEETGMAAVGDVHKVVPSRGFSSAPGIIEAAIIKTMGP
jgi:hypothetical protein